MSYSSPAQRHYHEGEYLEYQTRYATKIRESDKVLIEMIRRTAEWMGTSGKPLSLLDIGCHSGNLLRHLNAALPAIEYHGGDQFPDVIEHCKKDPELDGIQFEMMDIRDLGRTEQFDLVVMNAVGERLSDDEFEMAIMSVSKALVPGGSLFGFDWLHSFEQELHILEKTKTHPEGLDLYIRSFSRVKAILQRNGFISIEFHPFSIPIDLEMPADSDDPRTHTVRTEGGERLNFRGSVFQPWCHLQARKEPRE